VVIKQFSCRYLIYVAVCLVCASTANAHAILKESTPAPNAVITGPDITIRLRFNSRIDASHSKIELTDGKEGRAVEIGPQITPDTLTGKASGLHPGSYKVQWQVLATDGHLTRGEFPFTAR
jgi:methionine-rich copper-binding protein CopC